MKKKIISGLLFWVPVGGTILVVDFLLDLFDKVWLLVPHEYLPEQIIGYKVPGLSLVIVMVMIYITGHLVSNYFGNRLVDLWERFLDKIPGIRSFYRGIKQMTEAIFISSNTSFKKVFLIEYPRKGTWTVAFETSDLSGEPHHLIMQKEGEQDDDNQYKNLFVPTTPNPTSGYFIICHQSQLLEMQMGVDDALKMIVSGGIFVPKEAVQQLPKTEKLN